MDAGVGRHGPLTVAVLGSRDPQRSASVRDEILSRLRNGEIAAPKDRVRRPGVTLVGGGPGDPDLITVAGRRALQEADVVVADRLAPQQLLAELAPDVELVDAAKLPRGRAASQEAINALLVDRARAGQASSASREATRSSSAAVSRRPRPVPRPGSRAA